MLDLLRQGNQDLASCKDMQWAYRVPHLLLVQPQSPNDALQVLLTACSGDVASEHRFSVRLWRLWTRLLQKVPVSCSLHERQLLIVFPPSAILSESKCFLGLLQRAFDLALLLCQLLHSRQLI
jgi:hypothetical protein